MQQEDHLLEAYLKKLLEHDMSLGDQQLPILTDQQLADIALNSGMTESEYAQFLKQAAHYYNEGKNHLELLNYEAAKKALEECLSRYPNHLEASYSLAKTHLHLGLAQHDSEALDLCDHYIDRCLRLQPGHPPAIKLAALKANQLKALDRTKNRTKKRIILILMGLFIAFGILYFILRNTVIELEQCVDRTEVRLEQVYQRQAELIPRLKGLEKANRQELHNHIAELSTLYKSLFDQQDPKERNEYRALVDQQIQSVSDKLPGSMSSEQRLALHDQIEGSINRIYVEKRNYNNAVGDYNKRIATFPYSLLGFSKKPYTGHQTD